MKNILLERFNNFYFGKNAKLRNSFAYVLVFPNLMSFYISFFFNYFIIFLILLNSIMFY